MIDWHAISRHDGPQESPGFLFWRRFVRWQRGLNALLRPFGLTQPQFALLATCGWLGRTGSEVSQAELAAFLGLEPMHVSRLVRRLECAGLLESAPAHHDRRRKCLRPTQRGEQVLRRTLPLVEEHDAAFFMKGPT